jgi:hypothetical protein
MTLYNFLNYFRDLLKLCNRLNDIKNYESNAKVLMLISDIVDCLVAFISTKSVRLELAVSVGSKFSFNRDEVIQNLNQFKSSKS